MSDIQNNNNPPYINLDWPDMGSPLMPFIMLRFPQDPQYRYFPDASNNIYIENATFDVLNENGYSTASITLADPDFVNLEELFARALFSANSFSKDKLTWFVAAIWGWTFYGPTVTRTRLISDEEAAAARARGASVQSHGDQNELETGEVQQRASGTHYYMLTDLNYDLGDVELRVTFQLADVGSYIFGRGLNEEGGTTVGRLTPGDGVSYASGTAGSTRGPTTGTAGYPPGYTEDVDVVGVEERDLQITGLGNQRQVGNTGVVAGPSEEPPAITNYISGINVWDAIQRICREHKPPFQASYRPGDELTEEENVVLDNIEIPEDMEFRVAINKLVDLIPRRPPVPENQGESEDDHIREKFGIIASDTRGNDTTVGGPSSTQLVFGWRIVDVPKTNQIPDLKSRFRKARHFIYRPGSLKDITPASRGNAGYTPNAMIKSLSYDWTSRGYWNMHLPTVYAIYQDELGQYRVFFNEEDYKNSDTSGLTEVLKSDPSVGQIPLQEAQDQVEGLKIHFNFDTRSQGVERYTQQANTIIINVWNFLAKELVTVNIEVAGDPWLDNTLFSPDGIRTKLTDLLVDIYHSYFLLSVYKPQSAANPVLSEDVLLSGTYISIKGVSHKISEGDYTTSLQLIKVF